MTPLHYIRQRHLTSLMLTTVRSIIGDVIDDATFLRRAYPRVSPADGTTAGGDLAAGR